MSCNTALLHDLRSFRKDWARWSAGERLVIKMLLAGMVLAATGNVMLDVPAIF